MAAEKIEKIIRECAESTANENGIEIVEVEFVKENKDYVLRIFIDKDGGISTDDCEKISRLVEKTLDEKDPIDSAYRLEVSSPGLDRRLKRQSEFDKFAGRLVDIKLYKARDKQKVFQGDLIGLKNDIISIKDENDNILEFQQSEVASVRLSVVF